MKKTICLVMSLFMVISLMAGCGGNPSGADADDSAAARKDASEKDAELSEDADALKSGEMAAGVVSGDEAFANAQELSGEITVWSWDVEMWKKVIVPAFNEVYPNITVNLVNVPSDELKVKLLAALASGSGAPDVATVQGDDIVQYVENGGLLDLTDRMAPVKDGFPAYKIANNSDSKGRIYGVPMDAGPVGMFYRTDLFEKAGIETPPVTWEEWLEAGEKLAAKGMYLHRATSTGDPEFVRMVLQQQGGSLFDEEGNPTIDTPEMRRTLELQTKLVTSGVGVDAASWTPDYNELMTGDQLATHIGGAWYMNTMMYSWADTPKTWKIAPMPYFEGTAPASANNGGAELVIPEQSEKQDLAWAFVNFRCATVAGRVAITEDMGEFGCYMPAYEGTELMDATIDYYGDQKVFQFFAGQTELVPTNFRITPAFTEVLNMVGTNSGPIITGEVPLEEGIAKMQELAEAIVAKY